MTLLSVVLVCAIPVAGVAQPIESLTLSGKLGSHADAVYSPLSMDETVAYAGIFRAMDSPKDFGQAVGPYGTGLAFASGSPGMQAVLAFGPDPALHGDRRYFRPRSVLFWPATAHPLEGIGLKRADSAGETLSAWCPATSRGTAFLSKPWCPDPLNTWRLGAARGFLRIGFDPAGSLRSGFWQDFPRMTPPRTP